MSCDFTSPNHVISSTIQFYWIRMFGEHTWSIVAEPRPGFTQMEAHVQCSVAAETLPEAGSGGVTPGKFLSLYIAVGDFKHISDYINDLMNR